MEDCKIKFSWDIHYRCNFRCPYCWFYKNWTEMGRRNVYLGPDEWTAHWQRIYDKYGKVRIEITGGEPFLYPHFIELLKKLSSIHSVKITTNLSGDIERFVKEIDPNRVDLDLNFHILFIDLETVIRKTLILKRAGFKCGICYLAYPPQMHRIKDLSERFQKEGINFALAAFWGEYNGKKYPNSYTQEEKEIMRPFLGDIDRINYHLNAYSPKGKFCNAGYKSASVKANGDVARCGPLSHRLIGNIMDENFRLFNNPLSCESDSCPCNEYDNIVDEKIDDGNSINQINFQEDGNSMLQKFIKNKELNENETRMKKTILESKPRMLMAVLTTKCNLKCIMCSRKNAGRDLTLSTDVIKKIKNLFPYLEAIDWQGGEVFLVDYFKDLFLEASMYSNIDQSIITSGLLLDEKWTRVFVNSKVNLTFSIDAVTKRTYEYIRQGAKFERLLRNLEMINDVNNGYNNPIQLHLNVVVMRSNYKELDRFPDFCQRYDIKHLRFDFLRPDVIPEEDILLSQDRDAIKYLKQNIIPKIQDDCAKVKVRFEYTFKNLLEYAKSDKQCQSAISNDDTTSYNDSVIGLCKLPWRKLYIDACQNGDIFPDCICNNKIGNISEQEISDIWNSREMQTYRQKIITGQINNWCSEVCLRNIVDEFHFEGTANVC